MLRNYLKIAWKVLGRNRFFTFVSLFGISLTIGILLVLATLFDQITGKHYPENPDSHSLYVSSVQQSDGEESSWRSGPGFALIDKYIKKLQSPKRIALISNGKTTNSFVGDKKISLHLKLTCEVYWDMHQYKFIEGKAFQKQHIDEKAYVAVISRATRDAYFGEDVLALGKVIETDNTKYKVLGVVENVSEARIYRFADLYVPYSTAKQEIASVDLIGQFVAILEGGSKSDLAIIKQEYDALVDRLEVPAASDQNWKLTYTIFTSFAVTKLENISQFFSSNGNDPDIGRLFLFLSIAMLLFMLLPALNLINLNSSRIRERASEIGVRKAFGASSQTLTFQFIIENIVVTLIGGGIGIIIAMVALELIESTGVLKHIELGLRYNVFFMALLLCLFFGVLSGVLPAWRMSKLKVVNALKGINS